MGLGAIVVVGEELEGAGSGAAPGFSQEFIPEPLACVEVAGRTMLERTVERLVRAGVEAVCVLVPFELRQAVKPFSSRFDAVNLQLVADVKAALEQKFAEFAVEGIEHTFVTSASLYTETDLLDLFYFHREARQIATRAIDTRGSLQLWVVDCAKASQASWEQLLAPEVVRRVPYVVRDYACRMTHPRDIRLFVSDLLRGRCAARPMGVEARPGIWIDEDAEVHRRARIVAPAYIGRASKVHEDTLITRCSSIEAGCCIDYGTVIEDSSILADTQVGIWLEVAHSLAEGNRLFNLERNVILEISDPCILRASISSRREVRSILEGANEIKYAVSTLTKQQPSPTPETTWQFGVNSIQG